MLLVLDPAAVRASSGTVFARVFDRLSSIRHDVVLVLLSDGPLGLGELPEADYVIGAGGGSIERLPGHDPVEGWPPPETSDATGEADAVAHLADALMVARSDIFAVTGPGHRDVSDVASRSVWVGDNDAPPGSIKVPPGSERRLLEAIERLSMSPSHPHGRDICDEAFEEALACLRRNVTDLGFSAAAPGHNHLAEHDANYSAVWARDGVITGLWTLSLRDDEFTAALRRTLETLAEHQSPAGQIPAYVRLDGGSPDYSGIGGIASIDSVIWFVIGAARYAFFTRDRAFAEQMRGPVERAMTWLAAHDSNNDGLLEIPESSDWMDLFPRSYNVLYDEVLWYQACLDTAALLEGLESDGSGWRSNAERVKTSILEMFWPTGEQLMELAGSRSGRFSVGEARYLLSQVTPFDYSWRCDVYANLLAALTGLLDDDKRERLFLFLWGVGVNVPYPVTCLYPPIASGADDWKDYFLVNFLNLPDHYHNGGIWPFIGGLWVRFLYDIGRVELAHRELMALAEACRQGVSAEWEFNEWLHGHTGRPMGKAQQAWSAASFVQAYMTLQEKSEPAAFTPLDPADLAGPSDR
jgi:glycogen debranching enzyme